MCRVNLNPLISWTKSDNMGSTPLDRRRAENIEDDHKGAGQRKVMTGFWITMSFFFLVWYGLGIAFFAGGSSSNHGAPRLETLLVVLLFVGCLLSALPAIALIVAFCVCLPCLIWVILESAKEKSRGASTPDSLGALPTCKFKSKESGGRSGDEGGIVLAAGTEKERTLSGEEVVCCICLRKFADNDEVREVPCCSHFFHVGCLDKWLKIKARCPLCQSQLGVAAEGVTDATHSSDNPS
ncbi:E3 ubiquitin-protein ligase [Vitis vinifera]|uniref:E3 ubiquitin-protein ligase n=1 Tax=Vitis vinifera TaxID=29760 RepID=A0A438D0H0_VITVI|nr:E3 ubiquitin-protein ligase [Vitis vinifera]